VSLYTTRREAKEEEHALWAFAAVEVMRATGVRIEELTNCRTTACALLAARHRRARPATADRPVRQRPTPNGSCSSERAGRRPAGVGAHRPRWKPWLQQPGSHQPCHP
jgi:hypothetical protein